MKNWAIIICFSFNIFGLDLLFSDGPNWMVK